MECAILTITVIIVGMWPRKEMKDGKPDSERVKGPGDEGDGRDYSVRDDSTGPKQLNPRLLYFGWFETTKVSLFPHSTLKITYAMTPIGGNLRIIASHPLYNEKFLRFLCQGKNTGRGGRGRSCSQAS